VDVQTRLNRRIRPFRSLLVRSIAAACALVSIDCGSSSNPSAPTSVQTITAIALSKPSAPLKRGQTFQITPTVTFQDGHSAGTAQSLNWTTSDASVATVNATGLVTAGSDGSASISASSGSVSAAVAILVRSGGLVLAGVVTESAPTENRAVSGARVVVTDGAYEGTVAVTDASGSFTLLDVNGLLHLRITSSEFDDATVTAEAGGTTVTVRLMPTLRTVADVAERTPSPSPASGSYIYEGRLTFPMHHPGRVDLTIKGTLYWSDSAPFCTELRDETNHVVWDARSSWQMPLQESVSLPSGHMYELKVFDCFVSSRPTVYWFQLTARHPS